MITMPKNPMENEIEYHTPALKVEVVQLNVLRQQLQFLQRH